MRDISRNYSRSREGISGSYILVSTQKSTIPWSILLEGEGDYSPSTSDEGCQFRLYNCFMTSIAEYYHGMREQALREEIDSCEKEYILGVDPTEFAGYLFDRYALNTIEIDGSRRIEGEPVTVRERGRDSFGDVFEREVTRVRLIFPVVVK